ncbi:MAG: SusC/RagA family TonB-linked outer membrane protein [Bacteroidales bacterium]|nr:SusC/RagA family TonB-linked outer membrane protein [Bacteroidales bacterium]
MRKITLLLVSLLFAGAQMLQAQRTITGTVISAEDPQGLPGVTVQVQGTTTGTVTDIMGRYSINVPSNATTLVFSSVGMATQEIQIGASSTIDVTMVSTAQELEGVIIQAYGTTRRESFTGAVTQVSGATLAERTQSNIGKALAGAASGVQVTSASGQPGSEATIRIRGIGSINASSNPLIVIDGVPVTSPTFTLSAVNMAEVEALTVLKDAAANAMYGARGANGVILITTKRARAGKTRVSFEAKLGINQRGVPGYDAVNDPGRYMELLWQSIYNTDLAAQQGNNRGLFASQQLLRRIYSSSHLATLNNLPSPFSVPTGEFIVDPVTGRLNRNARLLYHDDWFDAALQNGIRQEYTATISGGTDKTAAFLSIGYLDDNSYTINSNFKRYSARLKVDQQVTDWLKVGMNVSYTKRYKNTVESSSLSLFQFAQQMAPIFPVWRRNADGSYVLDANGKKQYDIGDLYVTGSNGRDSVVGNRIFQGGFNPVYSQRHDINRGNEDRTTGSFYATIPFLEHFEFTANLTAQSYSDFYMWFQNPNVGNGRGRNGYSVAGSDKDFNINTQQLLNWNQSFHGIHNFEGLLGHEYSKNTYMVLEANRTNFLLVQHPFLGMGVGEVGLGAHYETNLAYDSYFARLQYNYSYKYYLMGSFRRDASSRFHPDHRWGNFWALGGAWRIEQEDFLKNASFGRHIDLLKFKASFGVQGNDNIGFFNVYQTQYGIAPDGAGGASLIKTWRGVEDLTWETSNNFNVGFDFALLRNRLSGTIEWYNKTTKDMLYRKALPPSAGAPSFIFENAIDMRNYGFEMELAYNIIQTKDLNWTVAGNITTVNNKLLKLPPDKAEFGYQQAGMGWLREGHSVYDIVAYEFAGIDPLTGLPLFWADYDANGVLIVDPTRDVAHSARVAGTGEASRRFLGKSGMVKAYGGLRTTVNYKSFDFTVTTAYQVGGWGNDGGYSNLVNNLSMPGQGIHMDQANNAWQRPGDQTNFPMLMNGGQANGLGGTAFLTNKSAFTLQSIIIGYTLPKTLLSRAGIESARVYATVDNTWLWSARRGFDPRVSVGGGSGVQYPEMRTYSLGININF